MATQPQIVALVTTAQRYGQQVLDFQTIRQHALRCLAVPALKIGISRDELVRSFRNAMRGHSRALGAILTYLTSLFEAVPERQVLFPSSRLRDQTLPPGHQARIVLHSLSRPRDFFSEARSSAAVSPPVSQTWTELPALPSHYQEPSPRNVLRQEHPQATRSCGPWRQFQRFWPWNVLSALSTMENKWFK